MNVYTKPVCVPTACCLYLLWMVSLTLCSSVKAQPFTVWGKVNANHLPFPNVKVVDRRSGQEAVTDERGKFELSAFSNDTLQLTHPDFPARQYVLPVLDSAIIFNFDIATNIGAWRTYREDRRDSVDPIEKPTTTSAPPTLPSFPWPIPPPSAKALVDSRFFVKDTTLAQVDRRLADALRKSGYPDPSYYQIPHGFAMVGEVEQIERNGDPKKPPVRWSAHIDSRFSEFALSNYLQHLYKAATGYFRVIVFLVTDIPPEKSQGTVDSKTAREWYSRGGDFLPNAIGRQRFTNDYRVMAQIYEFERPENSNQARSLNPGNCSGQDHLNKSKIMMHLAR